MKKKFITAALGIAVASLALPALSQDKPEAQSPNLDEMPAIKVPAPAQPTLQEVSATFGDPVYSEDEDVAKPTAKINHYEQIDDAAWKPEKAWKPTSTFKYNASPDIYKTPKIATATKHGHDPLFDDNGDADAMAADMAMTPDPMDDPAPQMDPGPAPDVTPINSATPTNEDVTPTSVSPSSTSSSSNVVGVTPFSLEANYMSLPGKLRYDTYASTGTWLTRDEAVAAVNDQINAATR